MENVIKIGYQGIEGSNSLAAAIELANDLKIENADFVPLVTSLGVKTALLNREIKYGVFATNNNLAGIVKETSNALKDVNYDVLAEHTLTIEHHLYVKDESVTAKDITAVASHIQAIGQCAHSIAKNFPNATRKELRDTAIGAKFLAKGTLPRTVGVLCRHDAGQLFGLHLLMEHLQDNKENFTDFVIIELK